MPAIIFAFFVGAFSFLDIGPAQATDFTDTIQAFVRGYGPDWPVCRNLELDPYKRLPACSRLIQGGKLTPKHLSWTYNNRGLAWRDLGRVPEALADYGKSIDADAKNASPYFNRAMIEKRQLLPDSIDKADRDLALAVKLEPADILFRCQRSEFLQHLARDDEALANAEEGLVFAPRNTCLLLHRGLAQDGLKRYGDAIATYSTVLEIDPRFSAALYDRALDYLQIGANGAAIRDLTADIDLAPDDVGAYRLRAEAHFNNRTYDQAIQDCVRVFADHPTDATCGDFQVRALILQNQFDGVIALINEAIATNKERGVTADMVHGAVMMRGVAEYGRGNYDQALTDFHDGVGPDDPYGAVLTYLAGRRLGRDDKKIVTALAEKHDTWPRPVLRYIAGQISADDVMAATDVPDAGLKAQREAEANFYLGELAALDGRAEEATRYYNAALAIGEVDVRREHQFVLKKPYNDVEIALAKAALHGGSL